jgi:integrase/recombinase XerC/integrase/recombinase XerD
MATVHPIRSSALGAPELGAAIEAFLAGVDNANTARAYATALNALAAEVGTDRPIGELDGEAAADWLAAWFLGRWGGAAPATVNVRLDALASACAWWRAQGWLVDDPTRRLRRRPRPADRTLAIACGDLEALLARTHLPLRERADAVAAAV